MTEELKQANPWGLTPDECATLAALIEDSHSKVAAAKLGVKPQAIESRVKRVREKMNGCSRVQAVVYWDRYARQQGAQA